MSSHVPKFGNWDGDNIPYTTFFENARRERAGMKMNPNDPEENPEAFMICQGGLVPGHEIDFVNQPRFAGIHGQNIERPSSEKQLTRSAASESGSSDRSSSGHSRNQRSHNTVQPDKNKKRTSESSVSSGPGHTRQKSGNQTSDDTHRRAASIPKFGAWDETDPRSGEGFTVIFNKVKEEKHTAASKFPTVPPQPIGGYPTYKKDQTRPSAVSKMCCCLFSKGSK